MMCPERCRRCLAAHLPAAAVEETPSTSRAAQGFDVRWHNIADAGSPIDKVHYEIMNAAGGVVIPGETGSAEEGSSVADPDAPSDRGDFTLRLWLEDAEGNVGAPATAPLSYSCVHSDASGGLTLTSGLGSDAASQEIVQQGAGSLLRGALHGGSGGVANAPLCVFSRVVTDSERDFLGIAVTSSDGGYQFAIQSGASRNLSVVYRPDHRELSADATLETVVHPTFNVRKKVVRNKHFASFSGYIPGPNNDQVVIVLQVRRGKGWLAFRRYRTREGGKFTVGYRFNRTNWPTKYVMRAQVRSTVGYPYLQGNSKRLTLIVLPARR